MEAKTPLTFRLYQGIKFNRPINKDEDYISPGGYELKMQDEDGSIVTVQFDFDDFEGGINKDDPTILDAMQKNPSYSEFPDLDTVTQYMLEHVVEVVEWFIYTGEPDEQGDNPLTPVEIVDPVFELINDGTGKEIFTKIPINVKITPENGLS